MVGLLIALELYGITLKKRTEESTSGANVLLHGIPDRKYKSIGLIILRIFKGKSIVKTESKFY